MVGGRRREGALQPGLLAFILASAFPAWVGAADEEMFFATLPVVATVSRLPQPLADAPGSVTVIDRELIRQSGARSLSDLLRLVPGFQVTPMNTDAPRVVYHGLSDEEYSPRVQVLIDGRSQYSPLFQGGVNWNVLPVAMEDIDRIEVVRGSNSAAYGSNAFLGVVNIITQDASQAKGATLVVSHGSQGVRDELLRLGARVGRADVRVTVKQQADEGYGFRPQKASDPADIADAYRQRLADLRADVALTERDELQVGAAFLENYFDTGRSDEDFNPPRKADQQSSYFHLQWRRNLSPGEELSVRYFHANERVDDAYPVSYRLPPPLSFIVLPFAIDRGGQSRRDDLEIQLTRPVGERGRLVWGLGSRFDMVDSRMLYYVEEKIGRRMSRLFGNMEWRFSPQVVANLGGTWEHDTIGGTTFAPRLNLGLHPAAGQTVRLGLSRAYRTPSTYEARGDQRVVPLTSPLFERLYLAAPGIKPERIDSAEIGYLGEFPAYRATVDLRIFEERIGDRVLQGPRFLGPPDCENNGSPGCGSADFAGNGERIWIRGLEYQLRWQPFDSTRLLLNQAFTEIDQRFGDDFLAATSASSRLINLAAMRTRKSSPADSTTLMLMQRLPYGLEFSATHHWVGAMRWTTNTEVERYRRLDLRLAYPFRQAGVRGEVAFVSQSANGDHAEFKASRIVSERHWLTLRLEL